MAWIESHQTLAEHPKTKRLARALGVSRPTTIGILHMLWWWAMDYAEDGDLSRYTPDDIADAVMWDKEPEDLINGLTQARFLDEDMKIHDWDTYAGKWVDKRKANAERMRIARAKKKSEKEMNVHGTFNARSGATKPNITIPNQTSSSDHDTLGDHGDSDAVEESPQDKPMLLPQQSEQLSLPDYCQEIEYAMVACGANPNYVVKKEALDWVKKFYASRVPIDFVKTGIQKCYDDNPEIHTFTYCARRIEEWWAKELAFQTSAEPIDFQMRLAASRASPNESRYVSQGLPPEVQEWDKFAKRGTS